jgi:hypothetical protein
LTLGAKQLDPHCRKKIQALVGLRNDFVETDFCMSIPIVFGRYNRETKKWSYFLKRQLCRLQYRKRICDIQIKSLPSFLFNDLHEALLKKNGPTFWKV